MWRTNLEGACRPGGCGRLWDCRVNVPNRVLDMPGEGPALEIKTGESLAPKRQLEA